MAKEYGRRVDAGLFEGCSPVRTPAWNKPNEIDRALLNESNATWKVVCECGETWYYMKMDVGRVTELIQYRHPKHKKNIFNRFGAQHSFRGTVPAMTKPGEE